MGFETVQKQILDIAWEKGYLNTIDHYEMLSDFTKLSRKQISDYRRKRSLKSGFPTPKPKEPHKPKKFDDMCRTFLKSAWELGYLPGKKHYGLLADFSGLSRKQISDWSRKYSIKLGLKGRRKNYATNNKRRMTPLFQIKNMAKRRRFDAKPIIPKLEVKLEDEDYCALQSGGLVTCQSPDPHFDIKRELEKMTFLHGDDHFFQLKRDPYDVFSYPQIPSFNPRFYSNVNADLRFDFPNISPPPSPFNEWGLDVKLEDWELPQGRVPRASEDDLWMPAAGD